MCDQSEMIMLEPDKEAIQAGVLRILAMIPKAHHLSIKNFNSSLFMIHSFCYLQATNKK